jgi:hypothetical protein
MTKEEILGRLRHSPEGKVKSVRVPNLSRVFLFQSSFRVPVFGYFLQLLAALLRLPLVLKKCQTFEADTHTRFALTRQCLNQELAAIQEKIIEFVVHCNPAQQVRAMQAGPEKPEDHRSRQAKADNRDPSWAFFRCKLFWQDPL